MLFVQLQTLPSLLHISWLFINLLLHIFPVSLSLRWWRPWMCCMSSWGAALLASRCRQCCWSGAWSSCTVCCSIQALGMRPERGSSGWDPVTGPLLNILQFIKQQICACVNCENGILTVSLWLPSRFCTRSSRASVCRSATSIALN